MSSRPPLLVALELLGLTELPATRRKLADAVRESCAEVLQAEGGGGWNWAMTNAYQLLWQAVPAAANAEAATSGLFVTTTAEDLRPDGLECDAGHTPSKKPR